MRVSALGGGLLYLGVFGFAAVAAAEESGWAHRLGFTAKNDTGAPLASHQVAIPLDGILPSSAHPELGADLRVGQSFNAESFLPHWIETPTSLTAYVWVRVDLSAGDTALYLLWDNPGAANTSDAHAVFDGDSGEPLSATNQLATGSTGGQPGSQRGFRFTPNDDVVLVQVGKREPNGTTRYITLFDVATETLLLQEQVSGPAEIYSYQSVTPRMLKAGTQYAIVIYQDEGEGYYYGTSTQINSHLTYGDMRYCNACSKDSFPGSALSNTHYGYADFRFLVRAAASPQPTVVAGVAETSDCNTDGTIARCGDSQVNASAGEECDDGNDIDTDACNECKNATCGDGAVHAELETCDDGNRDDHDACRNTCVPSACGDGVVQTGVEECDDGNDVDTDGCRNDCTFARCGDGVIHEGEEECDDGNDIDTDGCRNTCQPAACGDGVVWEAGEECDDGNDIETDDCRSDCTLASCGDGVVHEEVELCDDGNREDGDDCRGDCTPASCGDGVTQSPEACDDGDDDDGDGCTSACRNATCGDGHVRTGVEECDDHNQVDGDGCTATCELEPGAGMDASVDLDASTGEERPDASRHVPGDEPPRGTSIEPQISGGAGCTCRIGRSSAAADAAGASWALLFGLALWFRRRRSATN